MRFKVCCGTGLSVTGCGKIRKKCVGLKVVGDIVQQGAEYVTIDSEAMAAKYSLFDVVFPIIGNDHHIDPKSIAFRLCEEQLQLEDVEMSDFYNHNDRYFE